MSGALFEWLCKSACRVPARVNLDSHKIIANCPVRKRSTCQEEKQYV